MVIRDHHVHAQFPGPGYGLDVGDAGVHGKQYLEAVLMQLLDHGHVHAIPFSMAVRDMP